MLMKTSLGKLLWQETLNQMKWHLKKCWEYDAYAILNFKDHYTFLTSGDLVQWESWNFEEAKVSNYSGYFKAMEEVDSIEKDKF